MTRYPRAFQYRRVPAAPPRMTPTRQVFEFDPHDYRFGDIPEWTKFLQYLGANKAGQVGYSQTLLIQAVALGEKKGFKVSAVFSPERAVTITVTQPAPRLSAKLAATFPWKLRKHLKKP